jgi:predicted O-linked N-acetylglucosamine transferase (SPINDLY family)
MTVNSKALDQQVANIKKIFTEGNQEQAIAACQSLVFLHPPNLVLRKLLANLLAMSGKPLIAAKQLAIGFEFNPNDEELLFNLAICFRQGLDFPEAIRYFSIYVEKYPTSADGWGCLSECQFQERLYNPALDSACQAILLTKQDSRLFYNRSKIYRSLKQFDQAQADLLVAMQMQSQILSYAMEFAEITLIHQGRSFAKPYFEKVTQLKATDYLELLYLGKAHYELGQIDESISIYQKMIAANQYLELSYLNLGSAHYVLRQYPEALKCYQNVLDLNNNSLEANINLANTLQAQNRLKESIPFIQRALEIDPKSGLAYKLRAQSFVGDGFEVEILDDLLLAEKYDSSVESLQGHLLYSKLNICDWSELNSRKDQLQLLIKNAQDHVLPFQATLFFDLPELHQLSAQDYIHTHFPISRHPSPIFDKKPKDRLKIAYISPDFGQHPVSYLTAELFELHDRNQFEVLGVSLSHRPDDSYRLRIKNGVDIWLDVCNLNDLQATKLLRSHDIDIAIDLCGHTRDHRFSLWANRIAPLQISYLGYLGTMGCSQYIDYLIADQTIIPEDQRQFYDEKIIYLPSYQINDRKKPRPTISVTKESLGIPEHHFVFTCLNNVFKYHPEIFDAWMKILLATPNSSLVLFGKSSIVINNLKSTAALAQVDPNRLIFFQSVDYESYLARLTCIDLFLDTPIYNAGTTASDALWMGVPVITCIGQSFSARIAASVLIAAGLEHLITQSLEEYISLAIELASNKIKFQEIKNQIITNSDTCKLFDSFETTKSLEKGYLQIWKHYLDGYPSKNFII